MVVETHLSFSSHLTGDRVSPKRGHSCRAGPWPRPPRFPMAPGEESGHVLPAGLGPPESTSGMSSLVQSLHPLLPPRPQVSAPHVKILKRPARPCDCEPKPHCTNGISGLSAVQPAAGPGEQSP